MRPEKRRGRGQGSHQMVCDCHASSLSCSPVAGPPPEGECPAFSFAAVPDLLLDRCEAEAHWDTAQWGGESWLSGNPGPTAGAAHKPASSYSQSRPLSWLIFWNFAPVALRSFKNSFKKWKSLKPPVALELFTVFRSLIWFLIRSLAIFFLSI